MQHNGNGTREDLVLYRIETAKSDINSAKILLEAANFEALIIERIMESIMGSQLFML